MESAQSDGVPTAHGAFIRPKRIALRVTKGNTKKCRHPAPASPITPAASAANALQRNTFFTITRGGTPFALGVGDRGTREGGRTPLALRKRKLRQGLGRIPNCRDCMARSAGACDARTVDEDKGMRNFGVTTVPSVDRDGSRGASGNQDKAAPQPCAWCHQNGESRTSRNGSSLTVKSSCPKCDRPIELVTIMHASQLTGKSTKTIYTWMEKGLISYRRLASGARLVCLSSLFLPVEGNVRVQ